MPVPFSELPGRHERHYRRRLDNPLFSQATRLNDGDLLEAQRLDHEEIVSFVEELRAVVQRAVALKPTEESDVILKLKEDLERLYETSAGLADDQRDNQQAIEQLLGVVMRTIAGNAGGDALAGQELHMEAQARAMHFQMLQTPLIADLLHPQSLIEADQLIATLLSEAPEAVEMAVQMFDPEQVQEIAGQAQALLDMTDSQRQRENAWAVLALLKG